MPDSLAWVQPVTLTGTGVVLAIQLIQLTNEHATDLHAIADPQLFRHATQKPPEWSVRGFAQEIEKVLAIPASVAFAVHLVTEPGGFPAGRILGRTTFMDIKPEHRGLEIGRTWIGRPFHSTRVNPEAKYRMLRHAFEILRPTAIRMQLTTNGTNIHRQAAITNLGAVREGTLATLVSCCSPQIASNQRSATGCTSAFSTTNGRVYKLRCLEDSA